MVCNSARHIRYTSLGIALRFPDCLGFAILTVRQHSEVGCIVILRHLQTQSGLYTVTLDSQVSSVAEVVKTCLRQDDYLHSVAKSSSDQWIRAPDNGRIALERDSPAQDVDYYQLRWIPGKQSSPQWF